MNSIRQRPGRTRPRQDVDVDVAPAPPSADEELRRSYPAEPRAAALAREEVVALAERHGATEEQLDAVRLLVSEAVTNAVRHAYPDGAGTISAMATATAARVTLLVSDDGIGPRTPSRDPGAGWGWPLIAALSERFTIRRRSTGGTEVEMHVRIGRGGDRPAHMRRGSDSSASVPPAPRFSTTR